MIKQDERIYKMIMEKIPYKTIAKIECCQLSNIRLAKDRHVTRLNSGETSDRDEVRRINRNCADYLNLIVEKNKKFKNGPAAAPENVSILYLSREFDECNRLISH